MWSWRARTGVNRFGLFSLTRRILAVNGLAIVLLGAGMLYLDRYERGLIDTELDALETQGSVVGAAIGEGAVLQDIGEAPVLVPSLARGMTRRLVERTTLRARLFLQDRSMIADSRSLQGSGGLIQIVELPPPDEGGPSLLRRLVDMVSNLLRARDHYPPYIEHGRENAADYPEVMQALNGRPARAVRADPDRGGLILSVAVPVRHYKQVLGAAMLSIGSADLDRQVNSVRADILKLFGVGLGVTIVLSIYLAGTIARPVRRLAQAARQVRQGNGRQASIPDFSHRSDEIGELSLALADMTGALWRRMDAIERFAADVAHEIKNPLTSLRSAVETAARVQDPEKQRRLMAIIHDDVQRLDRLISDISDASRLDAEMSRLERSPVNIAGMLATLVDVHEAARTDEAPTLVFQRKGEEALTVLGKEGRLVQVFRNLISNAISFSPPGSQIVLSATGTGDTVSVSVEDSGPGIPEGKLEAIFDRFYTERPTGEKFGTHSGLGLSISKQIVDAHGGRIQAENRRDAAGEVCGARFIVQLPQAVG